ncbi:uncharacterized protein C15orf39 homolog isoform X1 [Ranitomeya imitator]|uniref:uncharacterized protein C15orf39 homolog isoform X1 n=1 Tax=Ranitomeya imitator TaxID=111125 RepID=UPI0037E94594
MWTRRLRAAHTAWQETWPQEVLSGLYQLVLIMAGKRHFGALDHVLHNKLSRLESATQRSTACFGIAATQDLQTCQNFMTYSMSDAEGHGSSSPWSSSAYLQYAGSTPNKHLQTKETSVNYQRPHTDRPHNPLQLSDNPNNQVSVHQNLQGHSYHMPYPRSCPPIAMPRPVYRNASNFMDVAYGSSGFQSMSVCVASKPLCPPPVEWSPSRFANSTSPLYVSGTKMHLSTPSTYPEVALSPSSLSHDIQEQNSAYRHRADLNLGVGVSATCSQKDIVTDACHPVSRENMQLFYGEGNIPLGKHRSSAFTTPSPQHNKKASPYQGSLDHRLGHLHSNNLYSNTIDNIHQRSSPLSASSDLTGSPHSVRGGAVYLNRAHHMHSGYVNAEIRAQTSYLDGTIQPNKTPFQVNTSPQKNITVNPLCAFERDKNLLVHSRQMNQDICGMSSRLSKEMFFDSTPTNRQSFTANYYREPFTGPDTHAAFVQQSTSSVLSPVGSSHELFSGQHTSRHSVTLKEASLHSSIQSYQDSSVTGVQAVENTTLIQSSRSRVTVEHAESIVPSPSSVSVVGCQYQMNRNNVRSRHNELSPEREIVEGGEPKSTPTSVSENVNFDNPKSPPMPVINDVFSLAPYRDYLEGKAPHPFSSHQESEAENGASTSDFLEDPLSEGRNKKTEGVCSSTEEVGAKNIKIQDGECVQTGEREVSAQSTGIEPVVLDLSLKKLPQSSSHPCNQQDVSYHDTDTLLTASAVKFSDKVGNQIEGQDGFRSSDSNRMLQLRQECFSSKAASNVKSQDSCPPVDKRSSLSQENRLYNENVFCQRQENIASQTHKHSQWMLQENCQSQGSGSENNNLKESSMSLATKTLSNQHRENDYSQSTQRFPSQHPKSSSSRVIERLTQQRQQNSSFPYKSKSHNITGSYKSHSNKSLSLEPHDNYSSWVPERNNLSSNTSQAVMTLPVQTSVQHSSHSDFSIFVNNLQTQKTSLPVVVSSSPTVYFTNTITIQASQPPSIQRPMQIATKNLELCHSLSSPSSSENENNGFQSSKSFMLRKYKLNKISSSEEETHRPTTYSISQNVSNPFLTDTVHSLPPSAPESSPALGEANVSLASVGEPPVSSSPGQQFSELHRSVLTTITSCTARSPSGLLEDWLSKTKEEEGSKAPVKAKNSSRSNDQSLASKDHDIWLEFDGVRLLIQKLLSQLETFMFTRSCPFPHVIRAGAIFIPICLVKEVLFSELLGPAIDKVLQKHKVELRPTTLSEEKLLRETKLKDCSSRMLKLLALKQLPDVYPDLLCLFCKHTIHQKLGKSSRSKGEDQHKATESSKKEPLSASPRKVKNSLILKLRRVRMHTGIHVYRAQSPKTPQKKDKLQKRTVCGRKQTRACPVFTYKKRNQRRTSKRFPNLVGRRILHLFDDGEQDVWFRGRVLRVHLRSRNPRDTQYEVWYDEEPGTRYFLELLQDYEKGWLRLDD